MRNQYRNILMEISASRLLESLGYQLTGKHRKACRLDPTMAERIKHSQYALC